MKKICIATFIALLGLVLFAGCSYSGEFKSTEVKEADCNIGDKDKAKVGYGFDVTKQEAGELVITSNADYSQFAIPLPYSGFKKAEVEFTTTGKTTVGFLAAGSDPWASRITGADAYEDTPIKDETKTYNIPDGAGFITFGSNGATGVKITIKKITIKM